MTIGAKSQRIEWIDLSKTICIYLVVLGHAFSYSIPKECFLRNFIYLFHLPVFFFVSGYLFRIKEEGKAFLPFLLSCFKSLIIPYIFLNLITILLNIPFLLYHSFSHPSSYYLLGHDHTLQQSLFYFLIGHGYAPSGPAWFLVCLFWIKVQMYFITRLCDRLQLLLAIIYGFVAFYFPWRLYWDIDASFMAMPIFIIGNLSKKHLSKQINKRYSVLALLSVFIVTLVSTGLLTLVQHKEAMFSRLFGTYGFLFYVGAFTGIVMIVSLSKLLERWNTKVVTVISSGSIIIMGLHGVFYQYTMLALKKLSFLSNMELNITSKVVICLIVLAEMYLPIIFLQKHCSQFLGGRRL